MDKHELISRDEIEPDVKGPTSPEGRSLPLGVSEPQNMPHSKLRVAAHSAAARLDLWIKFIDGHNGAFTAIATILIAGLTFALHLNSGLTN